MAGIDLRTVPLPDAAPQAQGGIDLRTVPLTKGGIDLRTVPITDKPHDPFAGHAQASFAPGVKLDSVLQKTSKVGEEIGKGWGEAGYHASQGISDVLQGPQRGVSASISGQGAGQGIMHPDKEAQLTKAGKKRLFGIGDLDEHTGLPIQQTAAKGVNALTDFGYEWATDPMNIAAEAAGAAAGGPPGAALAAVGTMALKLAEKSPQFMKLLKAAKAAGSVHKPIGAAIKRGADAAFAPGSPLHGFDPVVDRQLTRDLKPVQKLVVHGSENAYASSLNRLADAHRGMLASPTEYTHADGTLMHTTQQGKMNALNEMTPEGRAALDEDAWALGDKSVRLKLSSWGRGGDPKAPMIGVLKTVRKDYNPQLNPALDFDENTARRIEQDPAFTKQQTQQGSKVPLGDRVALRLQMGRIARQVAGPRAAARGELGLSEARPSPLLLEKQLETAKQSGDASRIQQAHVALLKAKSDQKLYDARVASNWSEKGAKSVQKTEIPNVSNVDDVRQEIRDLRDQKQLSATDKEIDTLANAVHQDRSFIDVPAQIAGRLMKPEDQKVGRLFLKGLSDTARRSLFMIPFTHMKNITELQAEGPNGGAAMAPSMRFLKLAMTDPAKFHEHLLALEAKGGVSFMSNVPIDKLPRDVNLIARASNAINRGFESAAEGVTVGKRAAKPGEEATVAHGYQHPETGDTIRIEGDKVNPVTHQTLLDDGYEHIGEQNTMTPGDPGSEGRKLGANPLLWTYDAAMRMGLDEHLMTTSAAYRKLPPHAQGAVINSVLFDYYHQSPLARTLRAAGAPFPHWRIGNMTRQLKVARNAPQRIGRVAAGENDYNRHYYPDHNANNDKVGFNMPSDEAAKGVLRSGSFVHSTLGIAGIPFDLVGQGIQKSMTVPALKKLAGEAVAPYIPNGAPQAVAALGGALKSKDLQGVASAMGSDRFYSRETGPTGELQKLLYGLFGSSFENNASPSAERQMDLYAQHPEWNQSKHDYQARRHHKL